MAEYNDGPAPRHLRQPPTDDLGTVRAARPKGGGGFGPYVINLGASTTPFTMPSAALLNWEHLHVYQVQRVEEGRLRFRLRLGLIMSELEADVILAAVRQHYPFALTATAGEDDLKAISAAVLVQYRTAYRTSKRVVTLPENAQESQAPHADRNSVIGTDTAPSLRTSVRARTVVASHSHTYDGNTASRSVVDARLVITSPPSSTVDSPVKRVLPRSRRRAESVTEAVIPGKPERPKPIINPASTPGVGTAASTSKFVVGRRPTLRPDPLLAVDSTQTLRALTPIELAEDQQSKWFVVELAVADSAFHPEDVLNLDIFAEFSLYSTIRLDQGRDLHALRLGFFTDPSAAQTVAAYVRRYFDAAVVKRVSIAERQRFAEGQVVARKISEATGVHEVIELSSPPPVPPTNLSILSKTGSKRGPDHQSPRPRSKPPSKR